LHTTNLLSGLMLIAIGVLFIVSEGTSSLEGFYASGGATDLAFSVERWAGSFGEGTLVSLVPAGLSLLFAGPWSTGSRDAARRSLWSAGVRPL
jgi:hypothetical protein